MQGVKKYLRKLNNIQRAEYEEKFKTFIFKTAFSIKKSTATVTKTRITIITLLKLTILIIFIKMKIEINAKKLICYNYNQINHIDKKKLINKKKLISTFKAFKKNKIQKFNLINIIEIDVFIYYYLIKDKKNKLFSLIINKIYDTLIQSFEIEL